MNNTKHTAGPWSFEREPIGSYDIRADLDTLIAEVWTLPDARLIAASPALLEALQAILNSDMAQRAEDEGARSPELEQARAAIALAIA